MTDGQALRPLDGLLGGVGDGSIRALARLLTLVEQGDPEDVRAIVSTLHPVTPPPWVIGVTGPPGVGKSTFVAALGAELSRRGRKTAVLAVDPSSPLTGGALLGDRVRMQAQTHSAAVFIRSMATRGHLGGLAVAVPHALLVLAAAGYTEVIIETVGVGQSEVDIAAIADTTVVELAPGAGDGVQAMKAGVLEIADLVVINKADQPGVGKLASELRKALRGDIGEQPEERGWVTPIIRTVAVRAEGVEEVVDALDAHQTFLADTGVGAWRRQARARRLVLELALAELRRRTASFGRASRLSEQLGNSVVGRKFDPYTAADALLAAAMDGATPHQTDDPPPDWDEDGAWYPATARGSLE